MSIVDAAAHVRQHIRGRTMEAEAQGRSMIQELDDVVLAVTKQARFARDYYY